jgi:acetyl esterase/lipase
MPLDRRAQRLLDMLAASGAPPAASESAADRREGLRALARMVEDSPEAELAVERREIPGPGGALTLHLYQPRQPAAERLAGLVFFHGGGWVAGGVDTHGGLCRRLAEASGQRVIAVDYRLAPEHRFPAAFEDSLAAVCWVADHGHALGVDPDRLAVGGDSAGGGLAAAVCAAARDAGGPRINLQLLLCPILDVAAESASRREFGEGYVLSRATMGRDLEDYCPQEAARSDPRVSPLRGASFEGLPPTLLHVAEFDPFRDEGLAYAQRLRDAGVGVEETCHAGMIHYFYAMPRAIPYAATAAAALGAQLRAIIG